MRIEIRKSGGVTCGKCGAHELLYVPALAQNLEADVRELFLKDVSRWRPLRRRRQQQVVRALHKAADELRSKTRFQSA